MKGPWDRKKPAIPRVPGTRSGQKGRRGNTLKMVARPDVVDTEFATACIGCGHRLSEADVIDSWIFLARPSMKPRYFLLIDGLTRHWRPVKRPSALV